MTVYYYRNGFLHTDDTPPDGAVALAAAEHEALVVGQCTGQIVMPGKDGKPVLTLPAPSHLHQWNGKEWTLDKAATSQLLAESIDKGTEAINDAVEQAYHHVTRFEAEYKLREQQARDYKAGDKSKGDGDIRQDFPGGVCQACRENRLRSDRHHHRPSRQLAHGAGQTWGTADAEA